MYCNKCGAVVENKEQETCPSCGAELYWVGTTEKPPLPMKWHKFLVYFALLFGAVINFIVAICLVSGFAYETAGAAAGDVYSVFPNLQIVDIGYSVMVFLFVAFNVYTWWQLKGFKKNAWKMVLLLYIVGAVVEIVYPLAATNVMAAAVGWESIGGATEMISDIVQSIIRMVIMVWCNVVYYNKRKHLFVK